MLDGTVTGIILLEPPRNLPFLRVTNLLLTNLFLALPLTLPSLFLSLSFTLPMHLLRSRRGNSGYLQMSFKVGSFLRRCLMFIGVMALSWSYWNFELASRNFAKVQKDFCCSRGNVARSDFTRLFTVCSRYTR